MILGELLNLGAVERTDAATLFRWLNDPRVMRFWGAPEHTVSLAEVQRWTEEWLAQEMTLGRPAALVAETLEGEAIGFAVVGRYRPDDRSAELSLMIGEPERWGQGFGTDLLRTLVATCFDAWRLHRLWVRSEASNERAHRLYARCGFRQEATLRDAAFLDGHYEDVLVFALLEHEQPDQRAAAGGEDG